MDSGTIVLKNIRRDIPALKPLAAKVICLQKDLIEAVKRYQDLNAKPDRDEAAVQQLLNEILLIDQTQREHLNLVREAEKNFSLQADAQEDNLYCPEVLSNESSPTKNDEEEERSHDCETVLDYRITGNEIVPKTANSSVSGDGNNSLQEESSSEVQDEPEEEDQGVMDWQDLTREQWSETDKLLQKVQRVGSRVLQKDFLSIIDLVHVDLLQQATECMARRKLQISQGKRVTTGPWQIFDVPTKVTNRRCNYLASGLHVTVRQKDPHRSVSAATSETGVKTRHQDSRGSSRTSSRASSPISTQTDSFSSRDTLSTTGKSRSMMTRASKVKRGGKSSTRIPVTASATKHNNSLSDAATSSAKTESLTGKPNGSVEPCVTYSVINGVPHFKVIFSSNDSVNKSNVMIDKDSFSSVAIDSGIEILRPTTASKFGANYPSSDNSLSERNAKTKMSTKNVKRPRLAQSFGGISNSAKASSVVETTITPVGNSGSTSGLSISSVKGEDGKEEVGLCLEKCGLWVGSPHYKIYRTFPSVGSSSSPGSNTNMAMTSHSITPAPASMTTRTNQLPKLTALPTPRLAPAPHKPAMKSSTSGLSASSTMPKMPKLTMGHTGPRNFQPISMKPPSSTAIITPTSTASSQSKLVPIAPKLSPGVPAGNLSNYVLVPFADKNQGALVTHQPPKPTLKRPISVLKSATSPGNAGQLLTVKSLKECLQNNLNYKDMKIVVQKVPTPNAASSAPSQAAHRLPAQQVSEDVKKKVVKLFPPPAAHHSHNHRHGNEKDKLEDSQSSLAPTVIVADMSA